MPFVERAGTKFPQMPERIAKLPVDDRSFPVPWFVAWVDGKPDHRVMDARKMPIAVKQRRCWICGEPLGRHLTFTIGPISAITRTSSEPPAHRECAQFAAQVCPFLSIPAKPHRDKNLPPVLDHSDNGVMHNWGVVLAWVTDHYEVIADVGGGTGVLFKLGEPSDVLWYREGRPATRSEVLAALTSGLPALKAIAAQEGPEALEQLHQYTARSIDLVMRTLPADVAFGGPIETQQLLKGKGNEHD